MPGVVPGERADGVTLRWSSVELADLFELNGFVTGAARQAASDRGSSTCPRASACLSSPATWIPTAALPRVGVGSASSPSTGRFSKTSRDVLTSLGIASRLHTESEAEREVQSSSATGR